MLTVAEVAIRTVMSKVLLIRHRMVPNWARLRFGYTGTVLSPSTSSKVTCQSVFLATRYETSLQIKTNSTYGLVFMLLVNMIILKAGS